MRTKIFVVVAALFLSLVGLAFGQQGSSNIQASTPAELVATYEALADTILGAKDAETGLVLSILSATYRHAEGVAHGALAKMQEGREVKADLEKLAALVSQLGNEGDAAVAAVRKRLLDGGHHHHASAEEKGIYDDGFVVVTRVARKSLIQSATEIGRMASSPNAAALKAEWEKVSNVYKELVKSYGKGN